MNNIMMNPKIEKVVLSIGGTAERLEKGAKLFERFFEMKPKKVKSKRRIPSLSVRPGLEVGCYVTLRGKKAEDVLKRMLSCINNKIKKKQISQNSFSFGIKEYIEVPGMQYQRDLGIMGFDVTVTFVRPGKRVIRKKAKKGRLPKKQHVTKEEIIKFMEERYDTEIK